MGFTDLIETLQNNRWNISQTTSQIRIEKLKKLRTQILAYRHKLYEALYKDFQKHEVEVELTEIQPTIAEINFCIKRLKKWMKPQHIRTPLMLMGTKSRIIYEARGLCLIISPWNYPFHLAMVPLISAVAAGNCIVLKPSEITTNTSALLKELLEQVFEPNEVMVVEGGVCVAKELLTLDFDHIFFTGSSHIGKLVMKAAAENLTSVTLELGGKTPVIVDKTANIRQAATRVMWGKFLNAGQTCVAPDYVFVHKSHYSEFIREAVCVLKKFYNDETKICSIVNEAHLQRLTNILNEAQKEGNKIEIGGEIDKKIRYISPTLLSNVEVSSSIMNNEIFGPILPILCYESINDAIFFIRNNDKPLAMYVFSKSRSNVKYILKNTTTGGACINNVAIHLGNQHLPFGGVGTSGLGSYHGYHGFKAFSHERSVLYQGKFSGLSFIYPPYTSMTKKLAKWVTNIFS